MLSFKSRLIRRIAAPWLLLLASTAAAQAPGEGLRFHQYTQEDGLTQNTVMSVAQDRLGFIWLGTEDGLHRFDGHEMVVLQATPGDESGLLSDYIQHLLVDHEGNLWVATSGGGVSRYLVSQDKFTHFRHSPDDASTLSSNYPYRLAENADGRIWVIGEHGVDLLNPDDGRVRRFPAGDESGLTSNDIWSILVDSDGVVWIGALDGLFRYDTEAAKFQLFREGDSRYEPFHDHTITALAETVDGQLLAATKTGLYQLNRQRELVAHFGPESFELPADTDMRLRRILATSKGEIWLSFYGKGVYWWDEAARSFRNYRHDPADRWSLSDDVILSMIEDRTGVIWFGTETGGVNKFNSATRAFQHFRHQKSQSNTLPNRVVWAILEDRRGNLWIGTDGGLSMLDRQRGVYTHYTHDEDDETTLSSPYVISLFEDRAGDIWVGTYKGISRLDRQTGEFRRYSFKDNVTNELYANSISFLREHEGFIWAGTGEGLFRLDPESGEYEQLTRASTGPGGLPHDFTIAVSTARAGGWWLGTEDGVVRFDPATHTFGGHLSAVPEGVLSHGYVMDLLEARDGTLWMGTDHKLNRIRPDGTVEHIGVEQGLPSNTIYSLLEDGNGNLWIGSNNGLIEYKPASGDVRIYDATDGLQSNEFNGGARFRSASGEMFFGGINGFNAFFPSQVGYQTEPPTVGITRMFKQNEEVRLEVPLWSLQSLPLSWRDSMVAFEFAVFDYAAPSKNQFRYRLEGFDNQWLYAIGRHHVTYTNLDPGEYVLRLQGANRHGIWAEEEAQLRLEVAPPPWRTWWAYALYLLAALTIVTGILRFYFVRLDERHQLETEQQKRRWAETLQQLTQALASSLDGHEVAEELLENLRSMVAFRKAVLFVEQGVEVHVAGAKGFRDDQLQMLGAMPSSYSRFFAEVRYARQARLFSRLDIHMTPLHDDMSPSAQFLAVPAYSRADEFALLLIGRDAPPFSDQECDIVSAFLTQALVSIDNARLFAELQNLATTDTLTQVHNRRYFFELAELEFARSRRYGRDVALILLDADNFKNINDSYGRELGDRMLKIIANCCRNNLRHFDIIGRYGGEDFVIMLPETPMNVAADVADRLRKSIESIRMETHKGELQVTVSVGVAIASEETSDLPALINRADMALYEAKRAGRNKVVVAER